MLVLLGSVLADVLVLAAGSISALVAEAGPLIKVFAQAGLALSQALLPALTALIEGGLLNAVALGLALAEALAPLVPIVAQIATLFLSQAMPALTQLQQVIGSALLPAIAEAALAIGGALLDSLRQLIPPALAQAAVSLATAWVSLIVAAAPLLPLFAQLVAWLIRLTSNDIGIRALTLALNIAAFVLGVAAGALSVLVPWFTTAARWGQIAGTAIRDGFAAALGFVRTIPGQIGAVFAGAGGWLADAGRRIINGLIDGIQSQINRLKAKLRELTNLIPDWKGPRERDRKLLVPSGRLIMAGLVAGIASQVPVLQAELAAITTDISREFTTGVQRVTPRAPSPLIGRFTPAPAPAEPGDATPGEMKLTAFIQVGDGPVFEAVEAAVAADPARFASHLRAGERSLTRRG